MQTTGIRTWFICRWISLHLNLYCGQLKVEASLRWTRAGSAVKLFCWPFEISKFNCVCMSGNERQLSVVNLLHRESIKNAVNCEMHSVNCKIRFWDLCFYFCNFFLLLAGKTSSSIAIAHFFLIRKSDLFFHFRCLKAPIFPLGHISGVFK